MSDFTITPEMIKEMQKFVLEHPIDHSLDEACKYYDGDVDPLQLAARLDYQLLKQIGKLPEGVE